MEKRKNIKASRCLDPSTPWLKNLPAYRPSRVHPAPVYFDLKLLPLPLPEHLPGFSSAREDAAGVEGQDPDEEIVGRVVTYVTWYGDTDTASICINA
jgi:hypothetical protein